LLIYFSIYFFKEKPIYELLGVICHSGYLNKGHYYTYSKNKVSIIKFI